MRNSLRENKLDVAPTAYRSRFNNEFYEYCGKVKHLGVFYTPQQDYCSNIDIRFPPFMITHVAAKLLGSHN